MVTNDLRQVLRDEFNFLLFRPIRPDFDRLGNYYLGMGLCASWLAGMGRYYDNPNAYLFQYLGLGSVAYVFVQWFLPFEAARLINIWFLVIVAIWRVALLFHYLMRSAQLGIAGSLIGGLLPLSLVVVILAMLNLQHVTFDIMAGVKTEGTTGMEATYSIILALTVLSFAIFPFSLLGYFYLIYRRRPDQPPV
jgi:hypothetical protein